LENSRTTIEGLAFLSCLSSTEKGTVPFFSDFSSLPNDGDGKKNKKGDCPFFCARMSERSEFRSRREGLRGNGVKNLNGSEAISQNLFISRNWKCWPKKFY
jgi:hypothetical protein